MTELPFQRRFQRLIVKSQARLEAGAGDLWIPAVLTSALTAGLMASALQKLKNLESGADLAAYTQASWMIGQGIEPKASLLGDDIHMLELGWSFILYPLALIGRLYPPAEVLVIAQAIALGLGVIPLWLLARDVNKLRIGAASALIVAYALHPATHRLGTDDFHPEALAVPALIAMAYFGATKRWPAYWLCIALALATRADLGLAVALWGFVVLGTRARTTGLWTLGVGLSWSLGLLLVVQPLIGYGAGASDSSVDSVGFGRVVFSALRGPTELFAQPNMALIVSLLAPVIFLPLLSLRHLAPALPLASLYLIAGGGAAFAERAAMLLGFVMIAASFALNRLGKMGVDRIFIDVRVLSTLVAAAVLVYVSSSPLSPYERPWETDTLDATDRAVIRAAEMLPESVTVRATSSALTLLAERPWLFAIDSRRDTSAAQVSFPQFVWAVLVAERDIPERGEAEREEFERGMERQGFDIVMKDNDAGVTLYSRADLDQAERAE